MKSMTGCHSSAFFLLGMTPPKLFPPCKVHHHGVGKNRGKESSGAHARTHTDTHGESVSQCTVTILQASSFFICLTGQNYRQFFDRGFGIKPILAGSRGPGRARRAQACPTLPQRGRVVDFPLGLESAYTLRVVAIASDAPSTFFKNFRWELLSLSLIHI